MNDCVYGYGYEVVNRQWLDGNRPVHNCHQNRRQSFTFLNHISTAPPDSFSLHFSQQAIEELIRVGSSSVNFSPMVPNHQSNHRHRYPRYYPAPVAAKWCFGWSSVSSLILSWLKAQLYR